MTEKEKMIGEFLYNAGDQELVEGRDRVKELCFEYNNTSPSSKKRREDIMREILGETKENFHIEPNFWCDYGYNISVGENFYMNHNSVILDCAKVTFGDNVFIGPNCGFYTAGHPLVSDERNSGMEFAKRIEVGNNVWFGGNVTVLPGVKIGDNVVIGGGSVVTKDIPNDKVVAGNPCKVIRDIQEADRMFINK